VPAERLLNGEKTRSKKICLSRFSLRTGETITKTMLIIASGMRSTIPQKSSTWRISKFLSLVWRIGAGFYSTYAVIWRVILGLARNLSICDSSQVVTICLFVFMTKSKSKDHSLMLSSKERTQLGDQFLGSLSRLDGPSKRQRGVQQSQAEALCECREKSAWPIPRTQYIRYHLVVGGSLSTSVPSQSQETTVSYQALGSLEKPELAQFSTAPMDQDTKITGHVVAHLSVSIAPE
jgi:hypothetical protein